MVLSRLEIEQMLREMNVKFRAEETYEELKVRLQQEHHRQWLKSVAASRPSADGGNGRLIRKRRKTPDPSASAADGASDSPADGPAQGLPPAARPADKASRSHPARPAQPVHRQRPVDKPAPGKPWKAVADGTEPFNRTKRVFETVLRRAGNRCERCGVAVAPEAGPLEPFYLQPLSQGGENSIKNVVALCPACRQEVAGNPDGRTLKALKRRTRSKLYDSLQVLKRRTVPTRRRPLGRRS